ncbi:MAG: 3'(2'),5'-bisphosphate nucleotidase [Planctomycetes bacterium]|nr:3'(2'),5'-bisphosphate nucleotidase [Planctomycetota bacterium]
MDESRELSTAIRAIRRAALVCRAVQPVVTNDPDRALEKPDRSPVTVADFASQALIGRDLLESFPADTWIAEEGSAVLRSPSVAALRDRVLAEVRSVLGMEAHEVDVARLASWIDGLPSPGATPVARVWTLDPIDGTKGFLRGEHYAISLALIIDGHLALGAVGCPRLDPSADDFADPAPLDASGTLVTWTPDTGARVRPLFLANPKNVGDADPDRPARVSEIIDLARARLCESVEAAHSSHADSRRIAEQLGLRIPPVRIDSQAKYAALATGRADIYLRMPSRPGYVECVWDHAGGAAIVAGAGGRVTDLDGAPLDFGRGAKLERNRGIVATNGHLHDAVLEAVRSLR